MNFWPSSSNNQAKKPPSSGYSAEYLASMQQAQDAVKNSSPSPAEKQSTVGATTEAKRFVQVAYSRMLGVLSSEQLTKGKDKELERLLHFHGPEEMLVHWATSDEFRANKIAKLILGDEATPQDVQALLMRLQSGSSYSEAIYDALG